MHMEKEALEFCSEFDRGLAVDGPAGVFLRDHKGRWRFVSDWTRDLWERAEGTHNIEWTWTLLRDRDSGFVTLALVTSPSLIQSHPRQDLRHFSTQIAAQRALDAFGQPPICVTPWS